MILFMNSILNYQNQMIIQLAGFFVQDQSLHPRTLMKQFLILIQNLFLLKSKFSNNSSNRFHQQQKYDYQQFKDEFNLKQICKSILKDGSTFEIQFSMKQIENPFLDLQDFKLNIIKTRMQQRIYFILTFQKAIEKQMVLQRTGLTTSQSKISIDSIPQQLLSTIFSSVSHEFGTYLNCIMTLSETGFSDTSLKEEIITSYFRPLKINSQLLNFILSNIRDFNQMLLKQFTLKLEEFDIKQSIYQLLENLELSIKSRNNYLEIKDDNKLNDYKIFNDSERFRQVLYQILANSIRFTQNGKITITLSLVKLNNSDCVKITIQDTGIGMVKYNLKIQQVDEQNQAEQQRLTEMLTNFQKLLKISQNSVGCGLGLSISNMIAFNLSAFARKGIQFTSVQNEGSTFWFFIANNAHLLSNEINISKSSYSLVKVLNENYYYESVNQNSYQEGSFQGQRTIAEKIKQQKFVKIITEQFTMQDKDYQMRNSIPQLEVDSIIDQIVFDEDEVEWDSGGCNDNITKPPAIYPKNKDDIISFSLKSHCCSRVLIVDDEYFNIISLEMILKKYETISDFAFNGLEALQKVDLKRQSFCSVCQNNSYSVFFLDINMPTMDGFETVQNLKKLMKERAIRKGICIAVTGFVDLNTKIKCFDLGMDFYISKPVKIKDLEAFINQTFR